MDNVECFRRVTMNRSDVRKILSSYIYSRRMIEKINLEIEELETNDIMRASGFEEKTGVTNKIGKSIEDYVTNKDIKIKQLEYERKLEEINCKKIENALGILKEDEKRIIELRYIKNPSTWNVISRKVDLEMITCQKIECKAIDKMIPMLI